MRRLNGYRRDRFDVLPVARLHPSLIGKDVTLERAADDVLITGPLKEFRYADDHERDPEEPLDIYVIVIGSVKFLAAGNDRIEVTLR